MEKEELFFFKKNVPYIVGVRMFIGDNKGKALSDNNPYVVVKESELRDFKRANQMAIEDGLILATKEPDWDIASPNAIDDEKAAEIVKNVFALKKALADFTGEVPIRKLLDQAEKQNRPQKTIKLIKDRLAEITGDEEDVIDPSQMQGVQ